MAWFGITIIDISGNIKKGVRYDPLEDINAYKTKALELAKQTMKEKFRDIQIVILADDSPELLEHVQKRRAYYEKLWSEQGRQAGKGKYSDRNYGKSQ